MTDVQRKGNKFGLCLAPGETDVGSNLARIFGQLAENLITASYAKKTGGSIPATIWADQASGFVPNTGVPATVSSMFDWLAARNPGLKAKAQAFSNFFDQIGFSSAVPDLIDQTKKEWYEIKPGSPTGLAAGMKKLANIPVWMQNFKLPYKPGTAYNPGPGDDIDLLPKLPFGFGQLIQMAASAIGGVEEIKVELVFRRMQPGLILYWICVSVTFSERAVDLDMVSDLVENIVRWTVIFTIRAGNGNSGNPQKPIEVTYECHDATIEECFVPSEAGLMGAVLRAHPAIGYFVVGGPHALELLQRRDAGKALISRLFLPELARPPRGDIALVVAGTLAIIALSLWAVTAMGQVEFGPAAASTSAATAAAFDALGAEATATAAELTLTGETAMVTGETYTVTAATGEQALQQMLAQQALREGLKQAGRVVLAQGTRKALASAGMSAMVAGVVSWSNTAGAAPASAAPAGAAPVGVAAPSTRIAGLELIQHVRTLVPAGSPTGSITSTITLAPRQPVYTAAGLGIFLYQSKVAAFPELNADLGMASGISTASLLTL